ncbi:ribonuclease H-like protein [Venturia nashicola]|nr:ribonuclease H-like protein [Venturia nashicola]
MISIPSSQLLGKLRNGHLTKLLVAIGARSTGNKNVLIGELVGECGREKLMKPGTGVASTKARSKGTTRVLSIDMGIKNLAFCVCDVPVLSAPGKGMSSEESEATQENGQIESTLELSVVAWKRIAVAGSTTPIGRKKKKKGSPENVDVEEKNETGKAYVERDDPFSPMQLSKTAFKLVREVLLPYNPDTILIERQRFRSGGGSAVQEWTVRVNMFESMIWAILTTLKNEGITAPTKSKTDSKQEEEKISRPQIWDVSPMRVATFWIGKEAKKVAERAKLENHGVKKGRTKVEKKEKVDLVQRWILSDAEGIEINEAVNLTFEDGAARTRDAFMASKSGPNRKSAALRKIKEPKVMKGPKTVTVPVVELPEVPGTPTKESLQEEPLLDIGKLDDLADCLLQAGAWTKWEMNRLAVKGMVEEGDIEGLEEWVSDNE